MRHFLVYYTMRKGLGPGHVLKTSEVVFDDIDPGITDDDLKFQARWQIHQQLTRSEDFPLYGECWHIDKVEEISC